MNRTVATATVVLITAFSARVAWSVEGFTEPFHQIELAAGEPGVLSELGVREGDLVRENQIVARLDTNVLEASLKIAKTRSEADGARQAAVAERDLRLAHFEKLRLLRQKGHATQIELERAETDYRIAQARVLIAEEELVLQQLECKRIEAQIQRRQIRSPVDGVVSEVFKEVGESFLSSDPKVMTIVQLNMLRARFSVSPRQAENLESGKAVQLTFPDSGDKPALANVETISPVMDAKSGTVQVTVLIDNSDGQIRSGARCLLKVKSSGGANRTRYTTKQSN